MLLLPLLVVIYAYIGGQGKDGHQHSKSHLTSTDAAGQKGQAEKYHQLPLGALVPSYPPIRAIRLLEDKSGCQILSDSERLSAAVMIDKLLV